MKQRWNEAWRRVLEATPGQGGVQWVVTAIAAVLVAACFVVAFAAGWVRIGDLQNAQDTIGRFVAKFAAAEATEAIRTRDLAHLKRVRTFVLTHAGVRSVRFVDGAGAPLGDAAAPATGGRWRTVEYLASVYETSRCPATSGDEAANAACLPQRAGTVIVGMTLEPYYAQRNLTIAAAVAFAAFVALLAVALVLFVAWKPLRTLEVSAAMSEEHAHLAEMRTRLVTVVSHEFRTPLAVIQVALDALRRYGDRFGPEQREGRMNAIAEAVGQLRDLLTEVIAVDQAEGRWLECALVPTDVEGLCRDVIQRADLPPGHRVEVIGRDGGPVLADPDLLRQLVRNLLSNAIKYSPPAGRISVSVEREGDDLVLRMVDRGIGIPARDLPHLFEPFQRAGNAEHLGGAGLGLASARRAAEAHGGSVTVRSIVGTGSTFEARIPYRPATVVAPAA